MSIHCGKNIKTRYFKYVYEDWTQPVLTSNTSYGTVTGSGYHSSRDYYHISDGVVPTSNDGADCWGTSNTAIGWVNWELPEEIIITGIKIYNRSHTTAVDYQLTGARFYTDSTKETPIGEEFEILTSQGIYELTEIPAEGIKTKNIYFYKTGNTYSGLGEIEITAKKIIGSVESDETDYDYTVFEDGKIKDLFSGKLHKTKYYKYLYEDWTQPVATASTTAIEGGDMVITASNEYSTYNAYKALDGVKTGTTATTGWGTYNTTAVQWWQLKLPYKIKITGLADYQRYDTTPANANTIGRFYTSSDKTTPIGDEYNNTIATNWNRVEVTGIPEEGVVTDTIYFEKTGGGAYGGLGELEITAQKQIGVEESTVDDYDYSKPYKGQIVLGYKGKDLIYSIYPVNGTIFEESMAGTYTFTPLVTGTYEISLVGPGSGGACAGDQSSYAYKSRGAGGGSGAYVCGVWNLVAGTTYDIVVGAGGPAGPTNSNNGYSNAAGDSSFGSFLVCGGGGGATAVWKGSAIGGAGGTVKTCDEYNRLITRTAGNQGSAGGSYTFYAGGAAMLEDYGAGGSGQATGNYAGKTYPGNDGYCKVRFLLESVVEKINVNFVGNVRFDNGVVSNFTTANYLVLPETLPSAEEFEFGGKITLAAKSTTTKCIYEISTSSWTGFNIALDSSSRLRLWTGSQQATGSTLEANKDYWFNCVCNSTGSTLYLSTDGVEYTQDINITNNQYSSWVNPNVYLGVRGYNKTEPLTNDFIDLNECYIKSNGEYLWKGIVRPIPHTFTINAAPENALVTINGEERNSLTALEDSKITWSVSLDGFKTQSGTLTLTEDKVLDITLEKEGRVPLWACYFNSPMYYYVQPPLSTSSVLGCTLGDEQVFSASEVEVCDYKSIVSVDEETLIVDGQQVFKRVYEGDLYE